MGNSTHGLPWFGRHGSADDEAMSREAWAEYVLQMMGVLQRQLRGTEDQRGYPIGSQVKDEVTETIGDDGTVDHPDAEVVKKMYEILGEYEHGSADCPLPVELYGLVVADIIVCLKYMHQEPCAECGVGWEGPDLAGNQGHLFTCSLHPDNQE